MIKRIYFNNIGEAGQDPQLLYIDTDNTLTQVTATGFLNKAVAEKLPISDKLMALVSMKTSPASKVSQTKFFNVTYSGGNWSLTAPAGTVKLFAQRTTTGGSATISISIPSLTTSDLAFTQVVNNGTNNVTILEAICLAGFLQINFSGDPAADCIFNYQILRPFV